MAITRRGRLGTKSRWSLAGIALGVVALMGTARGLTPDPRGFGTHTQLGLAPCSFRILTRMPCPACGMTTSFAWSVRGRFEEAWRANPAGAILAPALWVSLFWLIGAAVTGSPWPFRTADVPLTSAVVLAVGMSLAAWGLRLLWLLR